MLVHELLVDELIRVGADGHLALERPIEADDHEQHHRHEARYTGHEESLKAHILDVEEQREEQAAHRAGQQDEPHHARQLGVYGIEPRVARQDQTVIGVERRGVEQLLRL